MTKALTTLAVLLCANLVSGSPALVAANMPASGTIVLTASSPVSIVGDSTPIAASGTVSRESQTVNSPDQLVAIASSTAVDVANAHKVVASETVPVASEPIVVDPFAAEPFAGTSLKSLKKRINAVEKLYSQSQEFAELALAMTAAASNDRFFRRNCELLVRLTRRQPFAAFAAMAIFPEFLSISEELNIRSIHTGIDSFVGDCSQKPQRRAELLATLQNQLELCRKMAATQRIVTENIARLTSEQKLINRHRHVSTPPADFLKATNNDLIAAILQQQQKMHALLNQFAHHHNFCQEKLAYLQASSTTNSGVVQAADLVRMLRSSRDIMVLAGNYQTGFAEFAGKFTILLQVRSDEINKLVKRNSDNSARVKDFLTRYPIRDTADDAEPVFVADAELANTFSLLAELTRITTPERVAKLQKAKLSDPTKDTEQVLSEILSGYVNGKPWAISPENKYDPGEQPSAKAKPNLSPENTTEKTATEENLDSSEIKLEGN